MRKQVGDASRSPARHGTVSCERTARTGSVRALEIVVTRGRDVIGVRHLLDRGACWVGPAQSTIANIPMTQFGGRASLIAEVVDGRSKVHVPPRARARTHGKDGLGRLLTGPVEIEIAEGERAVVVLGAVQIRARVIQIETVGKVEPYHRRDAVKWLLIAATLYFMVFGICALVVPDKPKQLESGAMQRAVATMLDRAAEKARARASVVP